MRKLEQLYRRIRRPIEELAFPLILLLWPLIKAGQGIDVTDSTYSLGNYLFADRLDGVWVFATFLSNEIGSFLVRLPGGDTLLGINIYTGLLISATALIVYYGMRRDFTAPVVFAGEFLSISFCWIPSGILYNYLTYLLFNLTAICLYRAIISRKTILFYVSGILLGLNMFVRIPNASETALIIAVWIGIAVVVKKSGDKGKRFGAELMAATGSCIVGYVIGIAVPMAVMAIKYGPDVFGRMLTGLTGMSQSNSEYTIGAMILRTFAAYGHSLKWFILLVAVIFAGTLMMAVLKVGPLLKWTGRVIYVWVLVLMLRFLWGQGMYTFRYFEDYTSMYEWCMIILMIAWICVLTVLIRSDYNPLVKTYAALVLVILAVTPIGSNNYTMQNINNMFMVMPFVLYVTGGWLYRGVHRLRLTNVLYGCNFPWMSMLLLVFAMTLLQTTLFHVGFVFKDGMDGTPRDAYIGKTAATESVAGMNTTGHNAAVIEGLCGYVHGSGDIENAIYWGDCPGLTYILRIPAAVGSSWPDLNSYSEEDLKEDLDRLSDDKRLGNTAVIMRNTGAESGEDTAAKEEMIRSFIEDNGFKTAYENEEYTVYRQ